LIEFELTMAFDQAAKHVPSTVVIGDHGQPVVTRGYTEIAGLRIYDDQVVVGPYGQHMISKGWSEIGGRTLVVESCEAKNSCDEFISSRRDRWLDSPSDTTSQEGWK